MAGNCKYYKLEMYVSTDGGQTWSGTGEYSQGALIESASTDCGYVPPIEPQYRDVSGTPYCTGYDKYVDVDHQVSYDSGSTWETTATTSTLVEKDSEDCRYVPPTPIYEWRDITPTSDPNTYICDDCEHDYSNDYLTIRALGAGDVYWSGSTTSNTLSYSTDSGSTWSSPSTSITISVNSGDTVLFKGECIPYVGAAWDDNNGIGKFSATTTTNFDVEGNAMSLMYGDNFRGQTSLSGKTYAFRKLFSGCRALQSAENLSLPATTLASNCYTAMFSGCWNLATAPELPSTTMEHQCYYMMFYGCTSLTTAPSLPATTLAMDCYSDMFSNCTSLTTAPELPATTLASSCYEQMFEGCTSLTTAPTLSATTLAEGCYWSMFYECSSLNSITCLATNIYATSCTGSWLYRVAKTGTFTTPSSTQWESGKDGIPYGWTRINA